MLDDIDLSMALERDKYEKELSQIQQQLVRLQQRIRKAAMPVIVLYEGWDASGKGGSILRVTEKLDPRGYQVWPIGAPDEIERKHHYLWRFWTRLPERGQWAIFDRSWYGRVLVERVEELVKPKIWQRAYEEIRDFERALVDDGTVLIKFWMHISKDEQLKRFKEREQNPMKRWKIGPEDWRNRDKWAAYIPAVEQMLHETDTPSAAWHLIAAEDKRYARVATARIIVQRLEQALEY